MTYPGLGESTNPGVGGDTDQVAEPTDKPSPPCRQCRARKVRCDRSRPRCRGCTRLQIPCSFNGQSVSHSPERAAPQDLTQAGTKRKRSRKACQACRVGKFKCTGSYPCERCNSRGLICVDATNLADQGVHLNQQHGDAEFHGSTPLQHSLESENDIDSPFTPGATSIQSGSHLTIPPLDKASMKKYLETYLNSTDREYFLHKPTIFADWAKGRLDATLLKTLTALGWRATKPRPEQRDTARIWLQEVQNDVLKRLGRTSTSQLQVLVLLTQFHVQGGDIADAWNLIPLAARLAFTLRLNYERDKLDFVAQEIRRRLAWAIYELDRFFCGGIQDLAVCVPEMMHIRLPCDEQSFQRGVASRASFLTDTGPQDGTGMDIQAFLLKLLATRDRILRYTKRVRREGVSPSTSYLEMESLQAELDQFERNLPADLKLNPERLALMVHSSESKKYISLYIYWMLCHCDLYRFCVLGLRESISKEALAQTPADFINYCQNACLRMALRLCDFWADIWDLEPSERASDRFLPVSIYQVAQILRHLRHRLPQEGEHCVARLQEKLQYALKLAEPLKEIFVASNKCLNEAERVIRSLGGSHSGSSTRASSVADDVTQGHLASKFSLVPRVLSDSQARETEMQSEPLLAQPGGETSAGSVYDAAQAMVDIAGAEQDTLPQVDDLVPWDPFDVQMNDYYNPVMADLFTPLSSQHNYPVNF